MKPQAKIPKPKPNGAAAPWLTHEAPGHLAPETRAWWSSLMDLYAMEPHHVRVLTAASEAWDRAQQAREVIAKEGAYQTDRFGQPRAHPALGVERDSRIGFARLVRELGLDVEAPREPGRPPRIGA